jgi:hypothetical protein
LNTCSWGSPLAKWEILTTRCLIKAHNKYKDYLMLSHGLLSCHFFHKIWTDAYILIDRYSWKNIKFDRQIRNESSVIWVIFCLKYGFLKKSFTYLIMNAPLSVHHFQSSLLDGCNSKPTQKRWLETVNWQRCTVMGRVPFASILSLDLSFQLKAEQINKMTTIFTQNNPFFIPDPFDLIRLIYSAWNNN